MTAEGVKRKKIKFLRELEKNGGFPYAAAKSAGAANSSTNNWEELSDD